MGVNHILIALLKIFLLATYTVLRKDRVEGAGDVFFVLGKT